MLEWGIVGPQEWLRNIIISYNIQEFEIKTVNSDNRMEIQ